MALEDCKPIFRKHSRANNTVFHLREIDRFGAPSLLTQESSLNCDLLCGNGNTLNKAYFFTSRNTCYNVQFLAYLSLSLSHFSLCVESRGTAYMIKERVGGGADLKDTKKLVLLHKSILFYDRRTNLSRL
jgi:hypothetical protein